MPDDHSKLEPPLPIPNRTVKQFCANDSAATSVKVGYCQAFIPKTPVSLSALKIALSANGGFFMSLCALITQGYLQLRGSGRGVCYELR